jgi:hypothetical protein
MMVDGGGDTNPTVPQFMPDDSVARNAVNNAAKPTSVTEPVEIEDARIALGKLQSGRPLTDDEKRQLGLPVASTPAVTPTETKWVKARTINTANGPVDVDANGVAADGSRPVAVTTQTGNKIPSGFTPGPFPKELEQFFGSSEGVLGYRIETVTDKNGKTYNQLSIATGPNSSQTYGAGFTKDASGKYITYSPSGGNNNNNGNGNASDSNAAATKYAADLAAASEAAAIKSERLSAWAVLKAEFDKYGLGSLADAVKDMIINGTPSAQATMILRERPEYKARFAGNEARRTAGLNVYDEGTYLDLENTMAEIFTAYGQKSLMGSTREQQQATFAKYIGTTIAPTELKRRMDIATGLSKSDNNTLKAIKQLYPMIGDNDIVAYFLNPQETLPKLETKAQAASIGGAFLQQGLKINSASMEEYAALGVSREQAQLGAAQIAGVLPRAAQLRSYENGTYTQEQAEDVYLRQSATAKKELEDINKREIARLSGSAGTSKVSLKSAARNTF